MPIPVPIDFQEDVKLAQRRGERGDLELLAEEAHGFQWETEGVRLVGEAQSTLKASAGTRLARVVLFTGHMIDAPDRAPENARFPRTAKAEVTARALIEAALSSEMAQPGGVALGIAGGACGGDIVFHEVCASLAIPTRLFLALPPARFEAESVQPGGPAWVERYRTLCNRLPTRVLQDDRALPHWLADKPDYDIWRRNNLWMMFNALAIDARHLTLLALYNREREADGPGGTAHLVRTAQRRGFRTIELDARKLLEP